MHSKLKKMHLTHSNYSLSSLSQWIKGSIPMNHYQPVMCVFLVAFQHAKSLPFQLHNIINETINLFYTWIIILATKLHFIGAFNLGGYLE